MHEYASLELHEHGTQCTKENIPNILYVMTTLKMK